MPELPDLIYIRKKLLEILPGRKITGVTIYNPIIIRNLLGTAIETGLAGEAVSDISIHGPFLRIMLTHAELIFNFMLTGRLQYQTAGNKKTRATCVGFMLGSGATLNYADDKSMGKIYAVSRGSYENIPGYTSQGPALLGKSFSLEYFRDAIAKKRNQVRVFIMDQTVVSSIGNAYADEILFDAKIHPKTWCYALAEKEVGALYESIRKVILWGINKVEEAGKPIEIKVRDHMRVRNRLGSPCPVCGTKIRRANVLGYDAFFCPQCQPASRKQFIPWEKLDKN
jgi:formamidopyrimidine-DNA glycosylase